MRPLYGDMHSAVVYKAALVAAAVRTVQRRWLAERRRRCEVLAGLAAEAAAAARAWQVREVLERRGLRRRQVRAAARSFGGFQGLGFGGFRVLGFNPRRSPTSDKSVCLPKSFLNSVFSGPQRWAAERAAKEAVRQAAHDREWAREAAALDRAAAACAIWAATEQAAAWRLQTAARGWLARRALR